MAIPLPAGMTVFQRGWLSANNVLFHGQGPAALVDSGYATHSGQTLALVESVLGMRPLELLLNTHLHSDHCGGNAALQEAYPGVTTLIPPGLADQVRQWDPVALTYVPTGQQCPRFRMDGLLKPGTEIVLNGRSWQVHGAPGHDPHSIVLFEPGARLLISADALWANGFGVVFPELEGLDAFDEVGSTLDLIARLQPEAVIPGHGPVFADVRTALETARERLDAFVRDPVRHAAHACKVLIKFKLLELQRIDRTALIRWAAETGYMRLVHRHWFARAPISAWIDQLLDQLVRGGAARTDGSALVNA